MLEATGLTESDIYDRMVASILDHRLPPGTKLIEDKIAAAFGVSRTRIRPVLVRLANEQIVTLTPNRGASVAQPTQNEADEVFEVRLMIEPKLIVSFIEKANVHDINQLAKFITDEQQAREQGNRHRAFRLSGDFHLHIAHVAGHQTMGKILRELISRTSLILMTYGPVEFDKKITPHCGCADHQALLDVVKLRDKNEAARLMETHLRELHSQLHFDVAQDEAPDFEALFGGSSA